MATYKEGDTVIVTQDGVNRVGVVLDRYLINKNVVHDVLLENRSALCMITSNSNHETYLNKQLTAMLCDTDMIQTTVPYKKLLADEALPITKS
jgi:hypothetical protein